MLESLRGTQNTWLVKLLLAFNAGNYVAVYNVNIPIFTQGQMPNQVMLNNFFKKCKVEICLEIYMYV